MKNILKRAGFLSIIEYIGRRKKKLTEFKGNLGNYKILETEDHTQTIYSEFFDEACHNLSGAYEETIHNYILGCRIPDLLNQSDKSRYVSVLDVGFGVGVGLKCLMTEVQKANCQVHYHSIELDESLLLWSLKNTLPELSLTRTETLVTGSSAPLVSYQGSWHQLFITIFVGDGRITLPQAQTLSLIHPIDAIFQDAFSPKKNPALWSVEWFSFLKQISSERVLLSTYSSSVSIRKSLIAAGWAIENARGFAMKRSMTKANLQSVTSADLLLHLSQSPSLEIKDK